MIEASDITAVVLCGGRGARLDGHDKPLIDIGAGRMIDLICASLTEQVSTIVISCSRNVALYEALGYEVAVDKEEERGPRTGLFQAFKKVKAEWTLTLPGDTPFVPKNLVKRLEAQALKFGVAVPVTGGERQNLCLLLNAERRKELSAFHEAGGTAVKHWLDSIECGTTDLEDLERAFLNVNTPDDLTIAESRAHLG